MGLIDIDLLPLQSIAILQRFTSNRHEHPSGTDIRSDRSDRVMTRYRYTGTRGTRSAGEDRCIEPIRTGQFRLNNILQGTLLDN